MPNYPYTDGSAGLKHKYVVDSFYWRLVSEYTGLNFFQVGELDYVQYLAWLRDAFIYRMNKTEEGREYLGNAWRMEQTEPDRPGLRRIAGKRGDVDG